MVETAESNRTQAHAVTPDLNSHQQTECGEEFHSARFGAGELSVNNDRAIIGDVTAIHPRGEESSDPTS